MMAGFLLARAGIDVVVLEKHADFFRDFRGDTIHPSTLTLFHELGLLDALLRVPHSTVTSISGNFNGTEITLADLRYVPGPCKAVILMPQWDFLNFLAEQARRLPMFRLLMNAEATDLVRDGAQVSGVRVTTPDGALTISADLVIAADGRHSVLRERAGLAVDDLGAPIDVLWVRVTKHPGDPGQSFGNVTADGFLVAIDRIDYYQCAMVIRKGGFEAIRAAGLAAFRERIVRIAPYLAHGVDAIRSWDDVKLLTVMVDRLRQWALPGLVCIGDAAHAMSPVGGVGINLAIQDAVAAANLLHAPLRRGTPALEELAAVQRRRSFPTKMTQALQVAVQNNLLARIVDARGPSRLPLALRLLAGIPPLRAIPAYVIGIGFRPEHVRTPAAVVP